MQLTVVMKRTTMMKMLRINFVFQTEYVQMINLDGDLNRKLSIKLFSLLGNCLFACVQHVSASNRTLLHLLIDHVKF